MSEPVLIVGSLAIDDIETPFGKVDDIVGGAGYYASIAAGLFSPVRLVGVVGEDFPPSAFELLGGRGVNIEGVEIVPGGKSFRWAGRYHTDMNARDTLDTQLNVFADFNPILPQSYRDSRYVFLANIMPELQLSVLDQISPGAFVACDTMNFWIEGSRDALVEVLRRVDLVLMNDGEVRQFAGNPNITQAAETILELGPSYVAVKMGEYGAALISKTSRFHLPCCPLRHFEDPTGAGDSFAGGLMGYLAWANSTDEAELRTAVAFGTIAASFTCETFGPEALLATTPQAIYERYETLAAITEFSPCPTDACRVPG